eukprot:TRINITY_DN11607_c0_g1_i1.p1 TRINITY_DN11607_c0_g1~~TRINITY_DN11607_c0_g1_i1.p1  ORF type:complete len:498 (+),score=97.50 TRINITY_DN11607_c0_g1_i1:217-1494(+)
MRSSRSGLHEDWQALKRLGHVELGPFAYAEMMGLLCRRGQTEAAEQLLREMEEGNIARNENHYVPLANAYARTMNRDSAVRVFRACMSDHCSASVRMYNVLLPVLVHSDPHATVDSAFERLRPLDDLFAEFDLEIRPDAATYVALFSHICLRVADFRAVQVRMRDEGIPLSNSHRHAILRRVVRVELLSPADEILRFAQETYDGASAKGSGPHNPPREPVLRDMMVLVHRSLGRFDVVQRMYDEVPPAERTPQLYSHTLGALAQVLAKQPVSEVLPVTAKAEEIFREAAAREDCAAHSQLWGRMMACYAAANQVLGDTPAPCSFRVRGVTLMKRMLLSDAKDNALVRKYLEIACAPEGVPKSVPRRLTVHEQLRYREEMQKKAAAGAPKKAQQRRPQGLTWVEKPKRNACKPVLGSEFVELLTFL